MFSYKLTFWNNQYSALGTVTWQQVHVLTCTHPHLLVFCSGKCYKQVVLTPMLEKRSHDSVLDSLPHTVTLISMPSAANGKRGFSVSVLRDVNGSASVQVKEWVLSWLNPVPVPVERQCSIPLHNFNDWWFAQQQCASFMAVKTRKALIN